MVGYDDIQADMVLEKELRVEKELHFDPAENRKWTEILDVALAYMRPQSLTPQWYTSFNKTTPIPIRPHLLIVPLPLGAIFFQTTTSG